MQLIFLLALLAISLGLALVAAQAKDGNLLIGSATFMLVAAAFTLGGGGLEVQDGFVEEQNPDNTTTRTPEFTTLSDSTDTQNADQFVGLGLIGVSLYLFFQGVVPSMRDETVIERLTE